MQVSFLPISALQGLLLAIGITCGIIKLVVSGIFLFRASAGQTTGAAYSRIYYAASKVTPSMMFFCFMGVALLRHNKLASYLFGVLALGTMMLASIVVWLRTKRQGVRPDERNC
jgi:hypothetical protein